jgi:hypothetical protein
VIYNRALDDEAVLRRSDLMLSDNPSVGGRVTKFQAIFRGHYVRVTRRREDDIFAGKKFCIKCDKEMVEHDANELNASPVEGVPAKETWSCMSPQHSATAEKSYPLTTPLFGCPTFVKCDYIYCKPCGIRRPDVLVSKYI